MAKEKPVYAQEILRFITSNNPLPERIVLNKKHIAHNVLPYLIQYFYKFPRIISYLSQYNDLYDDKIKQDPIGYLLFLRELLTQSGISFSMLGFNQSLEFEVMDAKKKSKKLEEYAFAKGMQVQDLISSLNIENIKGVASTQIESNNKQITKKDQSYSIKKEKYQEMISVSEEKRKQDKLNKKVSFLKDLNKEIISELELTLIDTFVNENKNEVVYIFLDKDANKKYYTETFEAEIFVSNEPKIINNDYLVEIDDSNKNNFSRYTIRSYGLFQQLKREINNSFNNFVNQF